LNQNFRTAQITDLDSIVSLHRSALPDDLLPELGDEFLRDFFYPAVLTAPHVHSVVFEINHVVKGFVIFEAPVGHLTNILKQLLKKKPWPILKALANNPRAIASLISTLRSTTSISQPLDIQTFAELFVIGIDESTRGQGIGKKMVSVGLQTLQKEESNLEGCLVRTSSTDAKKFYESLGCKLVGHQFRGRKKYYLFAFPWPY
jgi:ribosomal protein S18 acetylase RimI-like enzyme